MDCVTLKATIQTVTTFRTVGNLDDTYQQLGHSEIGMTAKHCAQSLDIGTVRIVGGCKAHRNRILRRSRA